MKLKSFQEGETIPDQHKLERQLEKEEEIHD
jgi:hypothetical protein